VSFRSLLSPTGNDPVILLPIYTRCVAGCPVLTHKLETALASMKSTEPYRVISFDPLETTESLRIYRAQEHVPANWKIVRSDESEIRRFFEFFRYTVMDQDGALIHPNEVFILDQALNWRWTLVGEDLPNEELATAIAQTRKPGFVAWLKANPERIAWIGFAAIVLSISSAGAWLIFRKPSSPQLTT
jgi:cytochrome oxidase Cu insertion factor (SCO1/SenC/PrrC family)